MNKGIKGALIWVFIIGVVILLYQLISQTQKPAQEISFSQFMQSVHAGEVAEVLFEGDGMQGKIEGKFTNGKEFRTYGLIDWEVYQVLQQKSAKPGKTAGAVKVKYREAKSSLMWQLLSFWLPMIIIGALFFFLLRQMQSGGSKAMNFGKARARLLTEQSKHVTFDDVAGVDEAKEELEEIVEFLRDPKKFTRLGGRIPKGVLLVGPPGTGKTLLARAIAGEAGVPFFSISGSDFVEMFVGVGASRVRDLFIQGKKNAPCIIFIDELDAVGRWRGAGLGGGHDEREQTLNQLLVEMDGFESNEGVILISATNRPDVLDPALLRPGRFDRRVVVPRPDLRGREGILKVHTREIPLAEDTSLEIIARGTPGFSGADLENLINEAALMAARKSKDNVDMDDFEWAKDKVLMGSERRSMVLSDEEKRNTAYHEAGHALVALMLPGTDPVHKVTIIPRGMALGVTMQLPEEDKYNLTRVQALNKITVMMGGRAAEEIVLGQQTTGAGNDIEEATELARRMVTEWGMSDKLGPLAFGKKDEQVFLGKEISRSREYSEATAIDIDSEVQRIVTESHKKATQILNDKTKVLHAMAQALLDRETLTGNEIQILLEGGELPPLPVPEPSPATPVPETESSEVADSESFPVPPGAKPDPQVT